MEMHIEDNERAGIIRAVIAGVVLTALFAFFFLYPGHNPEPNNLPVIVVGGQTQLEDALEDRGFDVTSADTRKEAREAILDRDAYGALDLLQNTLLVSSAASVPVAEMLERVAGNVATATGGTAPTVQDVRVVDDDDPRGTSINLVALATTVPAILGALLLSEFAPALLALARIAVLGAFAVAGSLASVFVMHTAIGAIPGNFLALWAVTALAILAMSLLAAGFIELMGPPGIGLSFIVLLMLGNPASGAAGAPQLLPEPWATGGQFLPPGAFATGLRNTAYFSGANIIEWLAVLVVFTMIGAAAIVIGNNRHSAVELH